jgi:hypothetical protein
MIRKEEGISKRDGQFSSSQWKDVSFSLSLSLSLFLSLSLSSMEGRTTDGWMDERENVAGTTDNLTWEEREKGPPRKGVFENGS